MYTYALGYLYIGSRLFTHLIWAMIHMISANKRVGGVADPPYRHLHRAQQRLRTGEHEVGCGAGVGGLSNVAQEEYS